MTNSAGSFDVLLARGAELERLATGFAFTEGPVWQPQEQRLYFSDMPGDTRRSWSEEHGVSVVRHPSNKGNGLAYDSDGNLVVCEHATSRLMLERTDGSAAVLADRWNGHELNSPNDVVVGPRGDIYFSDPIYGRVPGFGIEREQDLSFQGVFRIDADGALSLATAAEEFEQPNGLCFSPDDSLLYINDTPRAEIKVFDVAPDGSLGPARVFADEIGDGDPARGVPDGMKCDNRGNIWVTGPGGVWVFDELGKRLGVLQVPETVGNLAWGGADGRDLFLCASTSLYRIRTSVRGTGLRHPAAAGA
ncbi:SMP-30/gluconolactonase/LRE family protein [Dactylosporangium sp. NPDC051484]|uniref:SMP-30/gluconolactonase/LRE family protein n=1 Tax=Dactylosporangium sp. NPDC051484 TaxID=3154942 RepID=UPI00344D63C1